MLTRAKRRRAEEFRASNEAALVAELTKALAVVWDHALGKAERSSLRASCSALRGLADALVVSVVCVTSRNERAAAGVAPFVRGVLARNGRPTRLILHDRRRRALFEATSIWLPPLLEFAAARCLRDVKLDGVPLTAEVMSAVAAAAPQLTNLQLSNCETLGSGSSSTRYTEESVIEAGRGGGSGSAGGSSGTSLPLAALLDEAAPTLHLKLQQTQGDWAPELSQALQRCTQLQSADVLFPPAAAAAALSTLMQLPALRKLELGFNYGDGDGPDAEGVSAAAAVAERMLSDLVCLTQLTGLRLAETHCRVLRADMLVPSVACLTGLVSLTLPGCNVRPVHLHQLQALAALTHLCCSGVDPEPRASDAALAAQLRRQQQQPAPAAAAAAAAQPLPLPPRLCTLVLCRVVPPTTLLSLQLPPSLSTLVVGGLEAAVDRDIGASLRPDHAQQLLNACALLVARMDKRGLFGRSLNLSACGLLPPPTWVGGFDALFAAVQPLALRRLHVGGVDNPDLGALSERFPLLENLELNCPVALAGVPSLSRLQHLHTLRLHAAWGREWVDWADQGKLFHALECLVREAPALRRLRLLAVGRVDSGVEEELPDRDKAVLAAAEAVVARLLAAVGRGSLQRRCGAPLFADVVATTMGHGEGSDGPVDGVW